MNKKIIRVSDAIPEMPLSFERTVERTLNEVCTGRNEKTARSADAKPSDRWTPQSGNVRTGKTKQRLSRILAVSCAAVLLLGVFAVGGIVLKNNLFGRSSPAPLASAAPEATKEATVPMNVGDHAVTIRLLPELPEAETYAEWRARALQPAFSEEDWDWIRRMDVSVHGFTVDGQTMRWVTVFRMAPGEKPAQYEQNPFDIIDLTGMDLFEDGTVVTWNGVEQKCSVHTEITTGTDSSDGAWIVSVYTQTERPKTEFAGTATVRQQFRLIDNKVDPQAAIATVGLIGQTFTFDASGAPAYVPQTPYPSQPQDSDPEHVTYSVALSDLLQKEDPDTNVEIRIIGLDYGDALESVFVYQGKTLTEYRNQPVLRAYSEAYDAWYFDEYPAIDEQNRDTPGWEKHDPMSLFDASWRERHSEAEIQAYELAREAYINARNAFIEWQESEAGREALQTIYRQECDRLNACGFSLQVSAENKIEGTAAVGLLRSFPAKDGYQYWITLVDDTSPIDE